VFYDRFGRHAAHNHTDAFKRLLRPEDGLELLHARRQDLAEVVDVLLETIIRAPPASNRRAIVPALVRFPTVPVGDGDHVVVTVAIDLVDEIVVTRTVRQLEGIDKLPKRRARFALEGVALRLHAAIGHYHLLDGHIRTRRPTVVWRNLSLTRRVRVRGQRR
jgi:hypothetical protein